jgi:predicted N-acetyltransferase YhbS
MKIRPIKKSEIKRASQIVASNYSMRYGKYAKREITAMFDNKVFPPHYLVVEENGEVLGFGGYIQSWMDYNIYNIFWVNVDPKYQRKGIGSLLVARIINEIKGLRGTDKKGYMILLTTDKPRFYTERFGFRILSQVSDKKYPLMGLNLK